MKTFKRFQLLAVACAMAVLGSVWGATNVAPEGFPHPVFRSGFALSIPLPGEVR